AGIAGFGPGPCRTTAGYKLARLNEFCCALLSMPLLPAFPGGLFLTWRADERRRGETFQHEAFFISAPAINEQSTALRPYSRMHGFWGKPLHSQRHTNL